MKSLEVAVQELKQTADLEERTRHYRQHVFPHYRKRFASQCRQRPRCDLLITAVGTQPFSPALAIAATSPRVCVLLTTHQTESLAPDALSLSKHRPEVLRTLSIGDGMDSGLVMDVVRSEYLRWGGGNPEEVTVDVTSGRKATAAALGAAAAALRLRQAYVESAELLPPGLGIDPQYHILPNVSHFEGKEAARQALVLLEFGHYSEAASEFARAGRSWHEVAQACEVLAASYVSATAAALLAEHVSIAWVPPIPSDSPQEIEAWRATLRGAIARKCVRR
ncbi:MAG: hypothetical protein AMXMBFR61_08510 [Fimbriimonadales bacterium]